MLYYLYINTTASKLRREKSDAMGYDITRNEDEEPRRKSGKCIIVGAGDFFGLRRMPVGGDLLIAADGGLDTLAAYNLTPQIILGDFDSLNPDGRNDYINGGTVDMGTEIIRFPKEKDDTDMMLAVKEGLERGYADFELYGGTGGRVDHFIANLQTLVYLTRRGANGWLYGGDYSVTAVTNGRLWCSARAGASVSVFAAGGSAEGVTLSGLKYPLAKATLYPDFPLGVSNEASGGTVGIEVMRGTLTVVIYD